ncbi:MAG TPA: peroxidase [Methylocella sp.]|nr:peroxidase [Methylocella sp.]
MVQPISEFDDIQAILHSGFGKLEEACFLLARITDLKEAKAWLSTVAGTSGAGKLSYHVTCACHLRESYQGQALQIAFTAQGLERLGVPLDLFPGGDRLHTFSREFSLGLVRGENDQDGHSRLLGDIGENAPSHWQWGTGEKIPDVLIMLYAEEGALQALRQEVEADLALGFEVFDVLRAANAPDDDKLRREPFGFPDGISQPEIDWNASRQPRGVADTEYTNLIAAGEFLLGYPNEYDLYTYRPLLDAEDDPEGILAAAAEDPGRRDFARNGSYLVFRQLEQDVEGFWRFVYAQSPDDDGVGLAEAMVGRRLITGEALVPPSRIAIPGIGPQAEDISLNSFTFGADPDGLACPFGAHIRRANPRGADLPGGSQGLFSRLVRMLGLKQDGPRADLLSSSRFHRIIRRGRPYGRMVDRQSALKEEQPGKKTGLYFIALNANISRQFEFIQNAWIINGKFNGLDGESDPLIGNRCPTPLGLPTAGFNLPQTNGPSRRILNLPQFITVRGGAYFFLPSLRALRYMGRQGIR